MRQFCLLLLLPLSALAQPTPRQLYPGLFEAVQLGRVYADGKTFVDARPTAPPDSVLARYRRESVRPGFDLKAFAARNFQAPTASTDTYRSNIKAGLRAHLDTLWTVLRRQPDAAPVPGSSLLPLPRPYLVPGGRFREVYYWDSYFTMLGLVEARRTGLVRDMLDNFAFLIKQYGHIPNGNRTYYLSRSQPPFFYAMVGLLNAQDPADSYARYLPQLRREYAFWMEGEAGLKRGTAHRRVVAMPDGAILNRYWDDSDAPRDESYSEDTELARSSGRVPAQLYRDVRAAAESGWDFGSRWFADGENLASINTTEIIPIDLNSLLFGLEDAISLGCSRAHHAACAAEFSHRASARRGEVNRYLWDAAGGVFRDYRWVQQVQVPRISAATLYPLFAALATQPQAVAVAAAVSRDLLKSGGIVTTPVVSGQQWDAPNGWPPLQWIGVSGLRRYSLSPLAETLACRWMANVNRVYGESGKLVEKYDVLATGKPGGGGEYPLQDGFGWTNGVMRKLMALYPEPDHCHSPP